MCRADASQVGAILLHNAAAKPTIFRLMLSFYGIYPYVWPFIHSFDCLFVYGDSIRVMQMLSNMFSSPSHTFKYGL